MLAAVNYDSKFLRLMLKHGGDTDAVYDDSYTTALERAFSWGIHTGDWQNLNLLIDAGADINRVPEKGLPIADSAIALSRPSIALLLLDKGYRNDRDGLAKGLPGSLMDKSSDEYKVRQKVIDRLKSLGVDYDRIVRDMDEERAAKRMIPLNQS